MPSTALIARSPVRAMLASAAVCAALVTAGCNIDGDSPTAKAMRPLSEKILSEMADKQMTKDSPILVRIFKEEAELEVWKQDRGGRLALLKTYPICRWSGELGPKIKEGDRQAPEGFYTIAPGQMNPKSSYYLAFNMGYPNAYDRSWNRTGSELMIHGDCSSRGCYAMTDEQVGEIYALARESFFGGQKAFQVQAFPFRMTAANMARHRNSPHLAFWKMLKQGYDHFDVTRAEPKVDVCERKYVFNAEPPDDTSKPLRFKATEACPAYQVPRDVMAAVTDKQQRDDEEYAQLAAANVPTAPVRTGRDGGMNPVFLAALNQPTTGESGVVRALAAPFTPVPGTIPDHTVPPGARTPVVSTPVTPQPAVAEPVVQVAVASAPSETSGSGNFLTGLFSSSSASGTKRSESGGVLDRLTRLVGLGNSRDDKPARAASRKAKPDRTASRSAPRPPVALPPSPPSRVAAPAVLPAAASKPRVADNEPAPPAVRTIAGAQPTLPADSFAGRWGALRE